MGKYGLVGTKPFHIESVIVGGHPMEWVYLEPPGTPILDDNEFFDRLKAGHPMVQ
jgi:hypothetical protein